MRSYNGCWTCRLRRKKCDERTPVCHECRKLHIECNYSSEKPEWMDGGAMQQEQAAQIKREIRHNAHLRIPGAPVDVSAPSDAADPSQASSRAETTQDTQAPVDEHTPNDLHVLGSGGSYGLKSSDMVLLLYYLEHVLPFLYPFYQPSLLQGGKAWILELMMKSPVVRKALLCQSAYFMFSGKRLAMCDTIVTQTSEAFDILRQALEVIRDSEITDHIHGATRIFASIMQVQRFEVAISSFASCQTHLNAALALFQQILDSSRTVGFNPKHSFAGVLHSLGPSSWVLPAACEPMPSAEQAAFRFSTALLIFDDLIASTVLRKKPQLLDLHRELLDDSGEGQPSVRLEEVLGCQNWVVLQIGRIANLAAWKQECLSLAVLDDIELTRCATGIKETLTCKLAFTESERNNHPADKLNCLDASSQDRVATSYLATKIWAHAAFLYLSVIASGMQPANLEVRNHVSEILSCLEDPVISPALMRTLAWPICVAGCLAESEHEAQFRHMAGTLHSPAMFATVRKAYEIMQRAWQDREDGITTKDLACYLHSDKDLVLLV